jgi:PAS domain S-box-containing protein
MKLPETRIPVVLLIEDERGDAELIRWKLLEKGGDAFEVHIADSLASVKKLIEVDGFLPDVVLLDLNLPDSSGIQTVERCRLLTDAPIVVLTGLDDLAATRAAIESGAEDFLSKGCDSASLRRALSYAMLRYRRDADARLATTVFAHIREGIMVTDALGSLIEVNQAFTQITGYTREDVIGRNPRFLQSGRHRAAFYQTLWQDLLANGHWRGELWDLRKSGELFVAQLTISVVRNAQGKVRHLVGIFSDITQRKESETLLLEAREQAETANRAKSRFLATMSHEIRTPMNGILGMAQLLLMPNLQDSVRNDYARTILSSGQALLGLLNDILDLSKIEAGKIQLESTVFSAQALIHEIGNLFGGAAKSKGLQIDCQWQGAMGQSYQADAHRLRQMLGNLVGNAIKFTAHGKINITAKEIEHNGDEAMLEFAVIDTGIGIPSDKLGLLFKPFSQADSSTTREFGGSGLGLSIVRSLALALGGEVGVSSAHGMGSRFWFRVPARRLAQAQGSIQSERAPAEAESASAGKSLHGHILVVEDNLIHCMVIKSLLRSLGLTVSVVYDGQQAVAAVTAVTAALQAHLCASAKPPKLVLMELQMPVLDGYEATKRIRRWEATHQCKPLPIIALTADAFEEDRQRCTDVGMDDFLTKPIAIEALKLALAKWLPAESQAPALVAAAVAPKALNRKAFSALVNELAPLLEENKFAAILRFRELQTLVHGTVIAEDIDALVAVLHEMRFDLVLERLRHIGLAHATLTVEAQP